MAWSAITAGGSDTTWSSVTAGNPNRFVGYATVADLWGGVDFVPSINSTHAVWSVRSERYVALWGLSVITSSGVTMEGQP